MLTWSFNGFGPKTIIIFIISVIACCASSVQAQSRFWGVGPGGLYGYGFIFEYDLNKKKYDTRFDFYPYFGDSPVGDLVMVGNGKLYGMTKKAGTWDKGALFEFDIATRSLTLKFSFLSTFYGETPVSGLTIGPDGKLYGTTQYGGANNLGVVFSFDPASDTFEKLFDCTGGDGAYPNGALVLANNGKLYGSTFSGGGVAQGSGVLFEFDPVSKTYTKVYAFPGGINGNFPKHLTLGKNGLLYGCISSYGAYDNGFIFSFDVTTKTFARVHDFAGGLEGTLPQGKLLLRSDGKLAGITYVGSNNVGAGAILFSFDPSTGSFKKDYTLSYDKISGFGYSELGNNLVEVDGKIYSTTLWGTIGYYGSLFSIDPTTGEHTIHFYSSSSKRVASLLVVPGKEQTVSFDKITDKLTDDPPFVLKATASSGLPVSFHTSDTLVARIDHDTVKITGEGTVTITAEQYGDGIWSSSGEQAQTIRVYNGYQSISFNALPEKIFGDLPFSPDATASSGLPVSYVSDNPTIASIVEGKIQIHRAGTVTITARQNGSSRWRPAIPVTRTLTILKRDQTIAFDELPVKTFGNLPFKLTASATSALPITYSSSNPAIATIENDMVTINSAGTVFFLATQSGNENWNAAPGVSRSLTINKANQTITFDSIPPIVGFPETKIKLKASASSQLPVRFYISSAPEIAAIDPQDNAQLLLSGKAGKAIVTCVQDGNANYMAAIRSRVLQVDEVTALEADDLSSTIQFMPNPATDQIKICSHYLALRKIVLIDSSGKIISEEDARQPYEHTLVLREHNKGIYMIRCITTTGRVFTERIVLH